MQLFNLRECQRVPISISEAWSFFSNPNNLPKITPPSLALRITSDVPGIMYAGMIVTYQIRPFMGIPVTWVTEITHVDEPRLFIDEQRFGPYRFWHHQHHFEEVDGGVELVDVVHYALRLPVLARPVNELFVRRQLREIFVFRRKRLEEMFGTFP
ncbi:MAG: SRPBCC family protein [Candidatus Abyssubacteria bacterium]